MTAISAFHQSSDLLAAAGRRRFDPNPAAGQANKRTGERLFQFWLALRCRAVEGRQQGLDLAKFGRALMTDAIDRPVQQPKPDLLRDRRKGLGIESGARSVAMPQREIAFGAIGQ